MEGLNKGRPGGGVACQTDAHSRRRMSQFNCFIHNYRINNKFLLMDPTFQPMDDRPGLKGQFSYIFEKKNYAGF